MTTPQVFLILATTSYVSASSIQSRQMSCPSPRFCDTSFDPADCLSIEQGYFKVDGQRCPGCQICIRKAELHLRVLQLREPVPERFLKPECFPQRYQEVDYSCRTQPYNGILMRNSGELYWDVSDEAGCLIMVCPLHGNFSECSHPVPHFRPQFYNDGEGRKCYVCDAITC